MSISNYSLLYRHQMNMHKLSQHGINFSYSLEVNQFKIVQVETISSMNDVVRRGIDSKDHTKNNKQHSSQNLMKIDSIDMEPVSLLIT